MIIRIGILGAAWIAPMAVIDPAREIAGLEVRAIAARDPARAEAFAVKHEVPNVAESYEALLARDDVDLVYVALPASAHRPWAIAALEAGKHVLCEKPIALSADETREMAAAAKSANRLLIEAFHYRHHPFFKRVVEIARSGEIGRIKTIKGRLHVPVPPRDGQIRLDPALGGGALMDLGCYLVHMARTITGEEPDTHEATARFGPTGVDLFFEGRLAFPSGAIAEIDCAMPETGTLSGALVIEGDKGRLEASRPILPHLGGEITVHGTSGRRIESADSRSSYSWQLEAVAKAIRGEAPPLPDLADALANMSVIDNLQKSAS